MSTKAPPEPPDTQAQWDREHAREFQRKVRRLHQAVRDAYAAEARAAEARKGALRRLKAADDALTTLEMEAAGPAIPDRWMYRFAEALAAAAQAKLDADAARSAHRLAVMARRRAQDERRGQELAHFRHYPLFAELEQAAGGNGHAATHAETPHATPAAREEAPAGEAVPANLQGPRPKPRRARKQADPPPVEPDRSEWRGVAVEDLGAGDLLAATLTHFGLTKAGVISDLIDQGKLDSVLRPDEVRECHNLIVRLRRGDVSEANVPPAAPARPTSIGRCRNEIGGKRCRLADGHGGEHETEPPYGWSITYFARGESEPQRCHYVGTEKAARKKAMLRTGAYQITECEPLTEEQYVRVYGRGKS